MTFHEKYFFTKRHNFLILNTVYLNKNKNKGANLTNEIIQKIFNHFINMGIDFKYLFYSNFIPF